MMARQHVASGYAGYMTVVSTLGGTNPLWQNAPHVAWLEAAAQPISLILASVVAGAFAIWPDIDHPGSTVSKKLGIIGSILSPLVRIFAFGHRGVTHSWIFVALNGLGIFFLSQTLVGIFGDIAARILVGILLALSALLITRLMLPGNAGKGNAGALVAAALVALVALHPDATDISWLPIAVAGGVFLHIVGDTITTGGTKFFLPFPVKIALPLVGNTNSWIERLVAGPLFTFVNIVFTLLVVIIPIFPAMGESLNKTITSAQGIDISGVFLIAIVITAFDLVTRVIAGKPEFGNH
jgi:membrane-bound metal-dependent hydrolase YbcI (DUF457 family)